ncbi:MAG: choice-of-anchor Q domain-containing protein, partial [Candidatus Binatia bacterium]
IADNDGGGAIGNFNTLTVTNSTFSGNSADGGGSGNGYGGAIYNGGPLTVTNSTFSGNSAFYVGGGIYNRANGPETNHPLLTVTNSTFSGNSATEGGAGLGYGSFGGAIKNDGTLTLTNCTFSGNSADTRGGGIFNGATLTLTSTIVASSSPGGNCAGTFTDGGHNIDDDGSCGFSGTSLSNTNPMLAGLVNNGGPTQTIALLAGSPAINAGDESVCATPPVNNLDQRGYVRPGEGATSCSIGAYEYNAIPASTTLSSAIAATDTCIPVSDTLIFSPTGGYALIGTELISYTGLSTSCSGASAARASAGTAATAGVLTGVTRNLNGQGGAHAAGTTVNPTAAPCVGDCNGNGSVTVDEILTLVNIALGDTPITACEAGNANHDGEITVDEILTAVNNALNGCGGG